MHALGSVLLVFCSISVVVCDGGPILKSFTLDMDSSRLSLTWSAAMSAAREDCDWSGVTLRTQNTAHNSDGASLSYTQSEDGYGTPSLSLSWKQITVEVHPLDRDALAAAGIGHNRSYTWIFLDAGVFTSAAGEASTVLFGIDTLPSTPLSALKVTVDATRPTLVRWTLQREERAIYMFFSEAVDITSADASLLSLSTNSTGGGGGNASVALSCSGTKRGRNELRELIVWLETACVNVTSGSAVDGVGSVMSSWTSQVPWPDAATDWERTLAALGPSLSDAAAGTALFLTAAAGFIDDYALPGNALVAADAVPEGFPDCQPCSPNAAPRTAAPNGTYRATPCTAVYDAVCAPCRAACPADHYRVAACTAEGDLVCRRCTPCAYETFEVVPCAGDDIGGGISGGGISAGTNSSDDSSRNGSDGDRVCAPCRQCTGSIEFEAVDCRRSSGGDRQCESCERCDWGSETAVWAERVCLDKPAIRQWRNENCCRDSEGEPVDCHDAILREIEITARRGRHPIASLEAATAAALTTAGGLAPLSMDLGQRTAIDASSSSRRRSSSSSSSSSRLSSSMSASDTTGSIADSGGFSSSAFAHERNEGMTRRGRRRRGRLPAAPAG
ncbi:unnamed protein product [Phaeothamnion confervicola]